jgi:hypothetical protein
VNADHFKQVGACFSLTVSLPLVKNEPSYSIMPKNQIFVGGVVHAKVELERHSCKGYHEHFCILPSIIGVK